MGHVRSLLVGLTAIGMVFWGLFWLIGHLIAVLILAVVFVVFIVGAIAYFLGESIIEFADSKRE